MATIGVIGANGRTGKICVEKLLDKGYGVKAAVHTHNTIRPHPNLTVHTVDGANPNQVNDWVAGCDTVVSLIGHSRKSASWVQTETTQSLVAACKQHNIQRLISLTGTGVRFSGDQPSVIDRFLNFVIAKIDPNRIADGISHAEVLKQSDLEWTIVRVLKLTNGPAQSYTLSQSGPARLFTARYTIAEVVCDLLASNIFLRQAPIIRKPQRGGSR